MFLYDLVWRRPLKSGGRRGCGRPDWRAIAGMLNPCRRNAYCARCGRLHTPCAGLLGLARGSGAFCPPGSCQQGIGGAFLRAAEALAGRAWDAADLGWIEYQQDAELIGR